ncbi:MAG: DSD1 family PLP-dependent enzyme [Alphaproteobacteria bacterium]
MIPLERHTDRGLVGRPGSRARLTTPALVLDLDALERNVAAMAAYCAAKRVGLRPHAKTHKSTEIARRQVVAGALGIACATLGEAGAMVEVEIAGVLVTSPMPGARKIARLIELAARGRDFMVVADDPDNVAELGAAARNSGIVLGVVVDVEVGSGRTGTISVDAACALAGRIANTEGLRFAGLQAYNGSVQSTRSFARRAAELRDLNDTLRATRDRLAAVGLPPPLICGGGTGSHAIDMADGVFTEIQAGSYVVLDDIYRKVALRKGKESHPFEVALTVRTTVISATHPGFVTTDAGLKAFATDSGPPVPLFGAPEGASYRFMGDEHGRISFAGAEDALPLGAGVECVTPHCDPTINLYDAYHVVRGDTLVDLWPITRGRW